MSDTHEDMIRIIYDRVLPEMDEHGIPDNNQNRISFLEGLRDSWLDTGEPGASPWIMAVNREILRLMIETIADNFKID